MTGGTFIYCKGDLVTVWRGALWFYCDKCGARLAWLVTP